MPALDALLAKLAWTTNVPGGFGLYYHRRKRDGAVLLVHAWPLYDDHPTHSPILTVLAKLGNTFHANEWTANIRDSYRMDPEGEWYGPLPEPPGMVAHEEKRAKEAEADDD